LHNVLPEINLDIALVEPVVADELALAVADFDTGEAVGLSALELHDVLLVIVAYVLAESGLLVETGLLPLRAVCVAGVVRALVPCLENGQGLLVVLHNHEAGVGVGAVEAIGVVLGLLCAPWVLGHDERVVRLDVPMVEHPLDGHVQEAESSIGVEEDDKLVVLDVVRKRRGLDPGGMSVFEFVGLYKLVVVAVDECIGVVVEDATRNVVDVAPVVLAPVEFFSRLEWPGLEIQDQDVAAERLLVARVRRQGDVAAIRFANERLGWRYLEVLVQQPDDFAD
jgi:hypothetical protein